MLVPVTIRYGDDVYRLVCADSGQDDEEFRSLVTNVNRGFRTVLDAGGSATRLQQSAIEKFPDDLTAAKEWWSKRVVEDPTVSRFLGTFSTNHVTTSFLLNQMAKVLFDNVGIHDVWPSIQTKLWKDYVKQTSSVFQEVYRQHGIPEEILRLFIPKSFFVEVDPDGTIVQIFERYGTKVKTIEAKRKSMLTLIENWNRLAELLQRDLDSPDPVIRLKALITSIMMHTGIRVGEGESTLRDENGKIIKDLEGNPVKIKTAGATSLRHEHVDFIRGDFARLEFVGKASHMNIVDLTDPQIVSVLRQQIKDTENNIDGYIFVTNDGRRITAKVINRYLRDILGPAISAHTFRHLYGTKMFFTELQQQQKKLADDLRKLKVDAGDDLEKQIVDSVVGFLKDATTTTQLRMHHDKLTTTIQYYVNPNIVLEFLSEAGLYKAIDKVLGDGRGLKLKFDAFEFYTTMLERHPASVTAGFRRIAKTMFYFGDRFVDYDVDDLIEELEE